MPAATPNIDEQIERVADRVADGFAITVSDSEVPTPVPQPYEPDQSARVTRFVAVLVAGLARVQPGRHPQLRLSA